MKDPVWWWCGGGVVVWWCGFLLIIIPTPVWVFDLDFDWGVAKKKKVGENNGQFRFVRHHVWRTQARLDQQ